MSFIIFQFFLFEKRGCYFLDKDETEKVRKTIIINGALNAKIVGQKAHTIAELAGVEVPKATKILIGEVESVDISEEFAHEKLSIYGYKSMKWKDLPEIFRSSAEMTGIIIFLIGVSSIMSWVMAFTNIPTMVSNGLLSISSNKYVILLMINIILLVVGTFMDMTPATLIFTPIFLPVCTALGMNTIHFGIMLIFNLCIGTITPPVGTTLFVGVKVGGVKIETVFKHLLPYFFAIIVVLMLVTYIPQLSLWLPGLMGYVS